MKDVYCSEAYTSRRNAPHLAQASAVQQEYACLSERVQQQGLQTDPGEPLQLLLRLEGWTAQICLHQLPQQ